VQVEFVSANPTVRCTGTRSRRGRRRRDRAILDAAGYRVDREYYVNDAGNQMESSGADRMLHAWTGGRWSFR
jgi:arginyl-tRNA synthetase